MTYFSVRLEEGMRKTLEYNHTFHFWVTPGLPIELEFLTGRENISKIYVSRNFSSFNNKFSLGVIVNENGMIFIEGLNNEFSSLEEIRDRHPQLFEVIGTLYTFP